MKLTFVYTDLGWDNARKFNQGVAQLSSCARQAGHETSLIHIFEEISCEKYQELLDRHNPDLVAFSSISNLFPEVKKLASWTRGHLDVPIVYGGPHPTLAPQECMETGLFDIICRGEGDQALVELCDALDKKEDVSNISNLWVKSNGQVHKNPIRPLIEDLDLLPPLDYELFSYENLADAVAFKRLVLMASRGCPYNCTYCCNHTFREMYPNKRKYVRFRSVDKVIDQISAGLQRYPSLERVRFFDDTLTINKSWFREFAHKYKERIGLPYSANDRVNHMDEEIVSLLKESGCYFLEFGIESGNARIREEVMRRGTPEKLIIYAFELCRKHGLRTSAFNIIGVPGETFGTIMDTVRLNARARPDLSYILYFHPFIGTKLHEVCRDNGYLTDKTFKTISEGPTLNLDTITETETVFGFTFFRPLVRLYRFFYRLPSPISGFFDKTTAAMLSCRLFPQSTCVKLMPCFQKCHKYTQGFRRNAEENIKKIPWLYGPLRCIYHFLFVPKRKRTES